MDVQERNRRALAAVQERRDDYYEAILGLERAMAEGDAQGAEREAKAYRDRFMGMEEDYCERLAFSALLLARKGDWGGIEEIVRRARSILGIEPAQGGGGKANAFLGG